MSHPEKFDRLSPKEYILIKGASINNLKHISVAIPRLQLSVVTGLSGSGKSSLAFDTLFAEGQRRYVESLSSYARQFVGRLSKPPVEYIKGLSPAIAIEQKSVNKQSRSTVGTATEVYDYIKLFFAKIGMTYSPVSGERVKKDSVSDVVDYILQHPEGTKVILSCPLISSSKSDLEATLKITLAKGLARVMHQGRALFIEDLLANPSDIPPQEELAVLIDRLVLRSDPGALKAHIADSVASAFYEGDGECSVDVIDIERKTFSNRFERDDMVFEEPSIHFFNFNNPYGACKECDGFGSLLGVDENKVIANPTMTLYEGAVVPWRSQTMKRWWTEMINAELGDLLPLHTPYKDLTPQQKDLLWHGNDQFGGIDAFFDYLKGKVDKIQYRVLLSRYRGKIPCQACRGTRVREDAAYVKINNQSIMDLLVMSIHDLHDFFHTLQLSEHDQEVAKVVLEEIISRLQYLRDVGLGYLTLSRSTGTLSGGEFQRIRLGISLGSTLVGTLYVLDEPTVGLHPRDTKKLVDILLQLKKVGNTVVLVEHEEAVMRAADQIIDIGPEAGAHGGELVFQGSWKELQAFKGSHTARYLNGIEEIKVPTQRRKPRDRFMIKGASENNLKYIDVTVPIGALTVVTGVSGSGKSTLVNNIIYPALAKQLDINTQEAAGKYMSLGGDFQKITDLELISQFPIGRSSRSNPVTYVKAYDDIRYLFASQPLSRRRGYKPAHFSFNMSGGRCEMCQGEGQQKIEMQFMADVYLPCESCYGKRFMEEMLDILVDRKSIVDVLQMTVDQSLEFFKQYPNIVQKLTPLQKVGLGYITLGQSSSSLSGGEAQRVKLAFHLGKNHKKGHTLFIFDEPTTGLHFHDIEKLLSSINALIDRGNSALVIEHNLEVIKCADWVIDLGPEGGEEGGNVVFQGVPEDLIKLKDNYTGQYLKEKL